MHVAEAFGGGVLGVIAPLSARLAEAGHRVAVAYGVRPETPDRVSDVLDATVEQLALSWRRRALAEQMRAARGLRRIVKSWQPDVIHLHSSFAGLVGALSLPGTAPLIYSPHGYSFTRSSDHALRRAAYVRVERFIARHVDVVGAVSASEAAYAREIVRVDRVITVPNGIPDLDPGNLPAPVERSIPRIVGMGRLDAARRPESTGRILSRAQEFAEVEWIGGGTATDAGIRTLESHGVHATGWLAQDEAKERLAQATAYLHWSAWDGQPLAILEAMARDVVVVASDIPPNQELLGPEQVCSTEDEAVELLRIVVENSEVRERLLAAQRDRRVAHSLQLMVRGWEGHYLQAARATQRVPVVLPETSPDGTAAL